MITTLDPIRYLELPTGIATIQTAAVVTAVANNQQLVAAVSGKRIRVMGWIAQAVGAAVGSFTLKSNSGGTAISAPLTVPVVTAGANEKLPISHTGYMETSTGHGLFTDVTGAGINFTIFYIQYTP